MARYDTTRRRPVVKPRCGLMKHIFLVMIGFALGYTAATFYHLNEVFAWVNTHVLMQNSPQVVVASKKSTDIPKPKFEFYTLLTQENRANTAMVASGDVTAAEVLAPTTPRSLSIDMNLATQQANTMLQEQKAIEATLKQAHAKEGYWVQLASFRRPQDAEKMKASLSLKGIVVTVMPVTQQRVQWFRIVLGPFANKFDAERAKKAVALHERIEGIVRKMDA